MMVIMMMTMTMIHGFFNILIYFEWHACKNLRKRNINENNRVQQCQSQWILIIIYYYYYPSKGAHDQLCSFGFAFLCAALNWGFSYPDAVALR